MTDFVVTIRIADEEKHFVSKLKEVLDEYYSDSFEILQVVKRSPEAEATDPLGASQQAEELTPEAAASALGYSAVGPQAEEPASEV